MKKERFTSIFLQTLISLPLLILFFGVIWQVFSRYVLSIPSQYSEELIRFALVFLTFLAGAYCFIANRHIALDLLDTKESGIIHFSIKIIQTIFILLFVLFVLIYGGFSMAVNQYKQVSSAMNISMFYIYSIMPISGIIIFFYFLTKLYRFLAKK